MALMSFQDFHSQPSHFSGSLSCFRVSVSTRVNRSAENTGGNVDRLRGFSSYLWLLARIFALAQNIKSHLVLVRLLLNIIGVGDDLLRLDLQPSLFQCLALDACKDVLAKVEVASRQFVQSYVNDISAFEHS